jgi:hypothetical protein
MKGVVRPFCKGGDGVVRRFCEVGGKPPIPAKPISPAGGTPAGAPLLRSDPSAG